MLERAVEAYVAGAPRNPKWNGDGTVELSTGRGATIAGGSASFVVVDGDRSMSVSTFVGESVRAGHADWRAPAANTARSASYVEALPVAVRSRAVARLCPR